MEIKPGRKIALAVTKEWYTAMVDHRFLKEPSLADHPTDLFSATVQDITGDHGVWVKPDEKYSDFPKGSMFVPWRVIVAAALLGPDDETKLGLV